MSFKVGNNDNSEYVFVCPKCGNELDPSSICENCFPNDRNEAVVTDSPLYESFLLSDDPISDEALSSEEIADEKESQTVDPESVSLGDMTRLLERVLQFYKNHKKKIWVLGSALLLFFTSYWAYDYFSPRGKPILFLEGDNLVLSYSKRPTEKQVIEKGWGKGRETGENIYNLASIHPSQDGRYVFYLMEKTRKNEESDVSLATLYRYDGRRKKRIKIDDNININYITDASLTSLDGTKVIYTKGEERKLILWNKGKKVTIDKGVDFPIVNEDLNYVFYTKESDFYEWTEKKGQRKFESEAALHKIKVSQSKLNMFYQKNNSLYKKIEDKPAVVITENVGRILSVVDDKIYYTTPSLISGSLTYGDLITDSLAEADKLKNNLDNTDFTEYRARLERENVRNSMNEIVSSGDIQDLYYFDGKKSHLIDQSIELGQVAVHTEKPILAYRKMSESLLNQIKENKLEDYKVDIKDIKNYEELRLYAAGILYQDSKTYLVKETEKGLIEQNYGTHFQFSEDGKWGGFIDYSDITPIYTASNDVGTLKKFKIEILSEIKPIVVDENVTASFMFKENDLIYQKGSLSGLVKLNDLYMNGKILLDKPAEIDFSSIYTFRTDIHFMKSSTSELYHMEGDSTEKWAKDVEAFVPMSKTSVIYLQYDQNRTGKRKLYIKNKDSKPVLISDRAEMILQYLDKPFYYYFY